MSIHPPRRESDAPLSANGEARPGATGTEIEARLVRLPDARIHDLDVRDLLRAGGEPFERIMGAVRRLPPDGVFRLRAIFEPVPLYAVLADLGFRHRTERLGPEDWRVWFFRDEAVADREEPAGPTPGRIREDAPCGATPRRRPRPGAASGASAAPRRDEGRTRVEEETMETRSDVPETDAAVGPHLLDVRKLAGPEKHPTIHRMFDALAPGGTLTIVNDHDPKPLYYELRAERADRFDAEGYRSYEAGERVWVAVLPTLP